MYTSYKNFAFSRNLRVFLNSGIPKPVTASWKYSKHGLFTKETFQTDNMSENEAQLLSDMANMGLSGSSHKVYKTAINHLKRCEIQKGINLSLPFDVSKTIQYINYLLHARNVKANTCEKYLSGIRMYHLAMGFDAPALRPAIVTLLLRGRENHDDMQSKLDNKGKRIAVTVPVMKLLKRRIRKMEWSEARKRLVWAVSCICWNGSFRIHEILSKKRKEFDPLCTLLEKDVKLKLLEVEGMKEWVLNIYLKTQKQQRIGNGTNVEIFGNDSFMCPIKAIKYWLQTSTLQKSSGLPIFRTENGECYTGADFNTDLIKLTSGYLEIGKLRAHSFRSGVATEMARNGFTDEEIKRQGRWSSQAYLNYIKLNRLQRIKISRHLIQKCTIS